MAHALCAMSGVRARSSRARGSRACAGAPRFQGAVPSSGSSLRRRNKRVSTCWQVWVVPEVVGMYLGSVPLSNPSIGQVCLSKGAILARSDQDLFRSCRASRPACGESLCVGKECLKHRLHGRVAFGRGTEEIAGTVKPTAMALVMSKDLCLCPGQAEAALRQGSMYVYVSLGASTHVDVRTLRGALRW